MQYTGFTNILKHQIIFLESMSSDQLSEPNWAEKYATYAYITPLYDNKFGSIENFSFGHLVTEAYFMFKIRFTDKINIKMRIKFGDRIFDIKRIINDKENSIILKIIAFEIT